jgi:AraC family transcriptional regulator
MGISAPIESSHSWLADKYKDGILPNMNTSRVSGKAAISCSDGFCEAGLIRAREVSGLYLTEATHPPGLRLGPHSHEQTNFCLLLHGLYEEKCGKDVVVRKPGTLALMASGAIHSNRIYDTGIRFFCVEMTRPWIDRANGHLKLFQGLTHFEKGSLPWLATRLYREFRCEDDVAPLAIEGLVLELLAGLARQSPESENGGATWLKKAQDFVHNRFQHSISLVEVAEFAGVHPVSLARAFRRTYQCTVGDYVRRLRVEFACQKLTSSDASLADIALSAGFSEQSHFSRTFKRLTGLTPSQYRSSRQS